MTDEIFKRLAAADPAASGVSVDPADSPQAELLRRQIMSTPDVIDDTKISDASRPSRARIFLVAAAAVAVLAGGAATYAATRPDAPSTLAGTTLTLKLASGAPASCINLREFTPSPAVVAFAGTVESVSPDDLSRAVVLDVTHWYQGGSASQVILQAAGSQMSEAVDFVAGDQYLVTADAGEVGVCSTGPLSPELKTIYEGWFGAS